MNKHQARFLINGILNEIALKASNSIIMCEIIRSFEKGGVIKDELIKDAVLDKDAPIELRVLNKQKYF